MLEASGARGGAARGGAHAGAGGGGGDDDADNGGDDPSSPPCRIVFNVYFSFVGRRFCFSSPGSWAPSLIYTTPEEEDAIPGEASNPTSQRARARGLLSQHAPSTLARPCFTVQTVRITYLTSNHRGLVAFLAM